jgi:hypothetical protein
LDIGDKTRLIIWIALIMPIMQMAAIAKGFSGFQRDSVMIISSLDDVV